MIDRICRAAAADPNDQSSRLQLEWVKARARFQGSRSTV
jgi:hypothetical protein